MYSRHESNLFPLEQPVGNPAKHGRLIDDLEQQSMPPEATDQPNLDQILWLDLLPSELLSLVFSFLDSSCPSESQFNEQPCHTLTFSPQRYLKTLSLVSKRFRLLVLPLLFTHACLDPYQLTFFLAFVEAHNLTQQICSVVASLQGPCNHLYPAWWARLLNTIPMQTFTILCAPHIFAELASTGVANVDSWAFNMPYQIIRLRQVAGVASQHLSPTRLSNLLTARPWTEFSVNEGSSLKAYTTYEYFQRRTPSLMATLHHSKSVEADQMFAGLRSFSFTAIFPFYNHVDEILKCVRKMKKLRTLFMKLCPEPHSTVLDDEINEAQGHIDVNDPWNEFDTAYNLVAHTVIFLTVEGELEQLRVDDVKMEGIRDTLENAITTKLQEWWEYEGDGVWKRKRVGKNTDAVAVGT